MESNRRFGVLVNFRAFSWSCCRPSGSESLQALPRGAPRDVDYPRVARGNLLREKLEGLLRCCRRKLAASQLHLSDKSNTKPAL